MPEMQGPSWGTTGLGGTDAVSVSAAGREDDRGGTEEESGEGMKSALKPAIHQPEMLRGQPGRTERFESFLVLAGGHSHGRRKS